MGTITLNPDDLAATQAALGVTKGTAEGNVIAADAVGLPAINASQVTNVNAAALTGTAAAINGAAITNLNAAALAGTAAAINGAAITDLNAAALATNTVPTARLGSGTASGSVFLAGDSTWKEAGGGGFASMQVFRVTDATPPYAGNTATWTKPAGIKTIKVYCTGGGGGAGSLLNTSFAGYGGAGGGTAIKVIDVTSISSVTVTLGKGGDAVNSSTNASDPGDTGGTSSFGSHCSATGGQGGQAATGTMATGIAYPGTGVGGDLNLRGGPPLGQSNNSSASYYRGSPGGSSFWGHSGQTTGGYPTGFDEVEDSGLDGAGGGGGQYGSNNGHSGGSGGGGIVVVEEYK